MAYSVTATNGPAPKLTLDGQLGGGELQNAWARNYTDTLNVLVLP